LDFNSDWSTLKQFADQTTWLMQNWKWLGLGFTLVFGLILKKISKHLFLKIKKIISTRQLPSSVKFFLLQQDLHKPLSWFAVCALWFLGLNALGLHPFLHQLFWNLTKLMLALNFVVLAYQVAQALGNFFSEFVKKTENTLDDQLAPFINKTLKIAVVALGVLLILQNFGVNVFSILAGLGIGGLALALAAQDTAANLLGSITIILDRPFQVGDLIRVNDTEGTVEEVGFRSTRIRTAQNSLVSIPNSTMAKEKIDNLGARTARRIRHVLGLSYDTPTSKIHDFMDAVRYLIKQNPEVVKEDTAVSLLNLGDFSLQILVVFHVKVTDAFHEQNLQQKILLEILDHARSMGVEFAYPTQTIFHKSLQ
jgi:MscS family membrane protein